MRNCVGRTPKQQRDIEVRLKKQGSLWGQFSILYEFIPTWKFYLIEIVKYSLQKLTSLLEKLQGKPVWWNPYGYTGR